MLVIYLLLPEGEAAQEELKKCGQELSDFGYTIKQAPLSGEGAHEFCLAHSSQAALFVYPAHPNFEEELLIIFDPAANLRGTSKKYRFMLNMLKKEPCRNCPRQEDFSSIDMKKCALCEGIPRLVDNGSFEAYLEKKKTMEKALLDNIKQNMDMLGQLLEKYSGMWHFEDPIYRFYYQSFKVFRLKQDTQEIVDALEIICPEGTVISRRFYVLHHEARKKNFCISHTNENWLEETRVLVEAFFHARYFLEMAVKYGRELKSPPSPLPSGWAALLCFYNLR